ADDKADEKGRESDSKKTSDLAAQEAQRALGEQSKAGLRGSGEVDLKKNGAASSRGDTGEFSKFQILTDKDAGKAGGDVILKTEKVSADSSLSDATKKTIKTLHEEFDLVLADGATVLKALEGKTKEQLREISKAYKEETGRDLATDIAKAQKFEKEHDEVPSSEKLGKALEVLKAAESGDKHRDNMVVNADEEVPSLRPVQDMVGNADEEVPSLRRVQDMVVNDDEAAIIGALKDGPVDPDEEAIRKALDTLSREEEGVKRVEHADHSVTKQYPDGSR